MRRKFDRYKRNRQRRVNPTRSRVFFPPILPFIPDFSSPRFRKPAPPVDPGYDGDDDYDYDYDNRRDEALDRMRDGVEAYRSWRRAQIRARYIDTQDLADGVLQALSANRPMALPYNLH